MGQMMARSWLAGLIAAVAVAGCAPLPAPGTDQRKRKLKREQLFGEMSPEELNKLITTDRYFQFERDIVEDGLHFIVCDQGVYDALMTLPGAKRKIVLLSYFGEMNDREIGDALGTGRANVQ